MTSNIMEIAKVRKQGDMAKVITIPKKSNLEVGDYVAVRKLLINQLWQDAEEGTLDLKEIEKYELNQGSEEND